MTLAQATLREIGDQPRSTIAQRTGISEAQLSRFLAGKVQEPTLSFIHRLEVGLELQPGTLLRAAGFVEDTTDARSAIEHDPHLPRAERRMLLRIYDSLRRPDDS